MEGPRSEPSLWLGRGAAKRSANSFSDRPGGLLALRDLCRTRCLHSCHLTRPPALFSAHVGSPTTPKFNAYSSKDKFSLRLQKCVSPARPVLQQTRCWEVYASLQAARWAFFVCTAGLLSVAFLQKMSKSTTVQEFKLRPV